MRFLVAQAVSVGYLLLEVQCEAGGHEIEVPASMVSRFLSRSIAAYLGSRENLGTESCDLSQHIVCLVFVLRICDTYASHEFENATLRLVEQFRHLIKAANHLIIIAYSPRHPARQRVSQVVVDVELAR